MTSTKLRALGLTKERSINDRVYGAAVVRHGLVDEKLMQDLVEARDSLPADQEVPPLWDELVKNSLLDADKAKEIYESLRSFLREQPGKRRLFSPKMFGRTALQIGRVTPAQLSELVERQYHLSQGGRRPPPLGQIALGLGMLSEADIEAIRDAQRGLPSLAAKKAKQYVSKNPMVLRLGVPLLIALFVTLAVLKAYYGVPEDSFLANLQRIEWMLYDLRFQIRGDLQPPGEVVIVDIDQRTMQRFDNRWPFSRAVMGDVVRRLTEAKIKALGWDVLFTSPDNPDEVDAMAELVKDYRRIQNIPDPAKAKEKGSKGASGAGTGKGAAAGEDEWPDEFKAISEKKDGGSGQTGESKEVKDGESGEETKPPSDDAKETKSGGDDWPDDLKDVKDSTTTGSGETQPAESKETTGAKAGPPGEPKQVKDIENDGGASPDQAEGDVARADPASEGATGKAHSDAGTQTDGRTASDAFYRVMMATYDDMLHDCKFAEAMSAARDKQIWIVSAMYFIPEESKETAKTYADLDQELFGTSEFQVSKLLDPFSPGKVAVGVWRDKLVSRIDTYQPRMTGVLGTIKPISESVSVQGFVNTNPEPDGVVRAMCTAIPFQRDPQEGYRFYPSMALQCAWYYLTGESGKELELSWAIASTGYQAAAFARDVAIGKQKVDLTEDGKMLLNYYGLGNWKEYAEVTVVGGGVSRPGTYQLRKRRNAPPLSIGAILREAGLVPGADAECYVRRVRVEMDGTEPGEIHRISLRANDLRSFPEAWLKSGDLIYVPGAAPKDHAANVYGEVDRPGPCTMTGEQMTLQDALAKAGGHKPHATIDVRRSCLIRPLSGGKVPFEACQVFEKGWLSDKVSLKPGDTLVLPRAYHRGRLFNYYSFIDIYDRRINLEELKGKVVMVGSTSRELGDYKNSPYGDFPGLEIQATYCQNLISSNPLRNRGLDKFDKIGLALMTFAVALLVGFLPVIWAPVAYLGSLGAYFGLVYYQFAANRCWYNLTAPSLGMTLSFGLVALYRYFTEQREKRKVRGMFSTMVSPDVLKYMEEGPDRFRLTGEKKSATMFFSDVAGFTAISESLTPEALAMVLNRYLTPMSNIILSYGGYIDKYEGDAIMADFGVPIWSDPDPNAHAWKCCWAALDQQEKLQEVRADILQEFGVKVDVRMGINTGDVSAGNMGSEQKFQYTVMGDAVNQAARFEPANKPFGTRIMIGERTYQMSKEHIEVRFLSAMIVKGKTEPVKAYELVGKKGQISSDKRRLVGLFEEGWRLHAEWKWDEAIAKFDQCLAIDPNDGPSKTYKEICLEYKEKPPKEGWKGEWEQTSK
jgi:class 3 adenylate cyclase/protein involved in polysaccharide export with SLBB domain